MSVSIVDWTSGPQPFRSHDSAFRPVTPPPVTIPASPHSESKSLGCTAESPQDDEYVDTKQDASIVKQDQACAAKSVTATSKSETAGKQVLGVPGDLSCAGRKPPPPGEDGDACAQKDTSSLIVLADMAEKLTEPVVAEKLITPETFSSTTGGGTCVEGSAKEQEPCPANFSKLVVTGKVPLTDLPLWVFGNVTTEGILACTAIDQMSMAGFLGLMDRLSSSDSVALGIAVGSSPEHNQSFLIFPFQRSSCIILPLGHEDIRVSSPSDAALNCDQACPPQSLRASHRTNAQILSNLLLSGSSQQRRTNSKFQVTNSAGYALLETWFSGNQDEGSQDAVFMEETAGPDFGKGEDAEDENDLEKQCMEMLSVLESESALANTKCASTDDTEQQKEANSSQSLEGQNSVPTIQNSPKGAYDRALLVLRSSNNFKAARKILELSISDSSANGDSLGETILQFSVEPGQEQIGTCHLSTLDDTLKTKHYQFQVHLRLWYCSKHKSMRDPIPGRHLKEAKAYLAHLNIGTTAQEFREFVENHLVQRFLKLLPKTLGKLGHPFFEEEGASAMSDTDSIVPPPKSIVNASKSARAEAPVLQETKPACDSPKKAEKKRTLGEEFKVASFVNSSIKKKKAKVNSSTPVVARQDGSAKNPGQSDEARTPSDPLLVRNRQYALNHFTTSMSSMKTLLRQRKPVPKALPSKVPFSVDRNSSAFSRSSSTKGESLNSNYGYVCSDQSGLGGQRIRQQISKQTAARRHRSFSQNSFGSCRKVDETPCRSNAVAETPTTGVAYPAPGCASSPFACPPKKRLFASPSRPDAPSYSSSYSRERASRFTGVLATPLPRKERSVLCTPEMDSSKVPSIVWKSGVQVAQTPQIALAAAVTQTPTKGYAFVEATPCAQNPDQK